MAKLHALHLLPAGATACTTPLSGKSDATAYVLECRVQKQYRALLFDGLADLFDRPATEALDYLLETAFPTYFQRPQRDRCQTLWQAEERVQYDIPEIISRLPQAELERLQALLNAGDLLGVVRYVWYELRPQLRRLDPTERYPSHPKLCQAAGLGTPPPGQAPRAEALPLPAPSTSPLPVASTPGARQEEGTTLVVSSAAVTPFHPSGRSLHHLRVQRAQERKRLLRKRR